MIKHYDVLIRRLFDDYEYSESITIYRVELDKDGISALTGKFPNITENRAELVSHSTSIEEETDAEIVEFCKAADYEIPTVVARATPTDVEIEEYKTRDQNTGKLRYNLYLVSLDGQEFVVDAPNEKVAKDSIVKDNTSVLVERIAGQ